MADKSAIEWTDASWNPIRARNLKTDKLGWHCVHLSEGCRNCYAEAMNKRLGTGLPYLPSLAAQEARGRDASIEIFLDEEMLLAPLRWKKPRMIFVCSMTDLFAEFVKDEWIDRVFAVMALCPQHTFQVLTKRAERLREYMIAPLKEPWAGRVTRVGDDGVARPETDAPFRIRHVMTDMLPTAPTDALNRAVAFMDKRDDGEGDGFFRRWPLPNAWIGVSCERQEEADERIPQLLQTPAAVRFVSAEPLLGPIRFRETLGDDWLASGRSGERRGLDWIIVGGESGRNARIHDLAWSRAIIAQCRAAGVAVFEKQLGSAPHSAADRITHKGCKIFGEFGFYRYLNDRKGGNWDEWPDDLRVREFPVIEGSVAHRGFASPDPNQKEATSS